MSKKLEISFRLTERQARTALAVLLSDKESTDDPGLYRVLCQIGLRIDDALEHDTGRRTYASFAFDRGSGR